MAAANNKTLAGRSPRASVLVVVLVTLLFASIALTFFMERASDDLVVEMREMDNRRLRAEAYSGLETVFAVLQDFRIVNGALRSPAEGWNEPLVWCGYESPEGRKLTVEFVDESAKFPLSKATRSSLVDMFKTWELQQTDAERVADALMHWVSKDHVSSSSFMPSYELDDLAFEAPQRPLRSWSELAAIDVVKETFFDESGRPNPLWDRFVNTLSLLDYPGPNLNAATSEVLSSTTLDLNQQSKLMDYLNGRGNYEGKGPGVFQSAKEAGAVVGADMSSFGFGTEIHALRIIVTVRDGQGVFRLNTVVSPSKKAKVNNEKANPKSRADKAATEAGAETRTARAAGTRQGPQAPSASRGGVTERPSLRYPFTILEIRENDETSNPVAPAP